MSSVSKELWSAVKSYQSGDKFPKSDFVSKLKIVIQTLEIVATSMKKDMKAVSPISSLGYVHSRIATKNKQRDRDNCKDNENGPTLTVAQRSILKAKQ